MRRVILFAAALACGLALSASASAATNRPPVVKRPQLVIVSATQPDGTDYPLQGGEDKFWMQLTRGDQSIGGKSYATPHNLNGFTPVANLALGQARTLPAKLRVGDIAMMCWSSGKLQIAGGALCGSPHKFVAADTKRPYPFRLSLTSFQPIPFD